MSAGAEVCQQPRPQPLPLCYVIAGVSGSGKSCASSAQRACACVLRLPQWMAQATAQPSVCNPEDLSGKPEPSGKPS